MRSVSKGQPRGNQGLFRCVGAALIAGWSFVAPTVVGADTHPRLWLTPGAVVALKTKAAAGDADWLQVKAAADQLVSRTMPRFSVASATNSNPVQFTLLEDVPWTSTIPVFIGGGSGPWAAVNATGGDRPVPVTATRTGTKTFTVPIDSSSLGSFSGQRLALFFSEGGFSNYGYQGSDWLSAFQTLGVAYQVTGNTSYSSKGVELFDYITSLGAAGMLAPIAIDSGYPSRSAVVGLALGYDWLYDRLTTAQKDAGVQALNLWYDWFTRAAFERNGPGYGNYFGGHVMGFGLAGYATGSDNPRGGEIIAHIRTLFDTHVVTAFTSGGFAGGYPVEVYVYGANHFLRLFYYMLAVQTATGEDLLSSTNYAQKVARNLLYNLKPNRWQVTDEGNYSGDYTGVLQPTVPLFLSHLLSGTQEGGWMQFMYQNLAASPYGGQVVDSFARFLFFDKTRTAIDYRATQPTWYHSPGDDHLYRRSSWQDDAVWTSITGGSRIWAGHQMRAAGHLSIQRGSDYLLVNSGQWKGASGVTGSPSSFDLRSWRGNTLFLDDLGAYLWTGADYVGGQGYWGVNDVLAKEGSPEFVYMKADLTTAYTVGNYKPLADRSLRHFVRNFVSLGSGVVVLFDRMQFSQATFVKKLFFHLNPAAGVPAISGNVVSSKVGSSALFIKTLLPASPRIDAAIDPVSSTDTRPITHRVEISDSVAGTTFNALNVLIATGSTTTAMPQTTLIQSAAGNMTGAVVMDGGTARVVLFAVDGSPQAAVAYNVNLPQGQPVSHVIADLTPATSFDVLLGGVRFAGVTASAQGVAVFQSQTGGAFELRSGGAAPPPGPVPAAPTYIRIPGRTTASAPVIGAFSAAPTTLPTGGGTATLSWQVSQADSVAIDGVSVTGESRMVTVSATTSYTLTARNAAGTATASATVVVGQNPSSSGSRYVAMIAPVLGETFVAPASLRLVAAGRDPSVYNNYPANGLGGNAAKVQFFVDDAVVLEVDGSQAEFWIFKGFVSNVAAGQRRVWARAFYTNPTLVLDSAPVMVDVQAAPTYSTTVNLTSDLTVNSAYSLLGTNAGRVRVNGNGYRIVSGSVTSAAITFQNVDFFDLGDRTSTSSPGIDLTTSGGLVVENCRFDSSNTVRFTVTGSAAANIRGNTFRSNMRQPLGQYPDANGGTEHGSFPVLVLRGSSTGTKVFQGNNVGAGWVLFQATQKWLVGGDVDSASNVLIGPRVGMFLESSSDIQIRRNYSHHNYHGGWSQGSNLELGGLTGVTTEHNVIIGSSWPVRGVASEFRYNLVLEAGHQWLWADHTGAYIHHNVFIGGDNDIGGIYALYSPANVRIQNNTFDGLNRSLMTTALKMSTGAVSLTSNLFVNVPKTPVTIDAGATLSADYNLFWNNASPAYSDNRTPAHDVTANPHLANPAASTISQAAVWTRTLGVRDILARYRAKYAPAAGSPALTLGDSSGGPGSFIGAIGDGVTNAADLFGK